MLIGLLALFAGCGTQQRDIDMPERYVPEPSPAQIAAWRGEAYRSDPCQVAHYELQMRLDVPWKGERFAAEEYTFYEHDEKNPTWGSYVVRGYVNRSGHLTRYRVKLKRDGNVWYATQLSHYLVVDIGDPRLDSPDGRPER